ncbi:hypothetical protein [Geodermatophilus sp. URMC 60]
MTQPLGVAALPRFLAHGAAGAAGGCAAVHALGLVAAPHSGTALLSAACLLCAVHLWRRPGRAAWGAHVVLTTAMLAVHPPVVPTHHAATGLAAWAGPVAGLLAVVALLLAAVRGYGAVRGTARCAGSAERRQRCAGQQSSVAAVLDGGPARSVPRQAAFAPEAASGTSRRHPG